jgi:hypothetical protein
VVGVGVAVGERLADGDGVGDEEIVGVGSALGVAGAGTLEEGSGEPDGTSVPVAEGWLVCDVVASTGTAGGGAAASAIPAVIVAIPAMAPSPSSTGIQGNACFVPDSGVVPDSGFGPDSGPSAVTVSPCPTPTHRSSARW